MASHVYSPEELALLSRSWEHLVRPGEVSFDASQPMLDVFSKVFPEGIVLHQLSYAPRDYVKSHDEFGKPEKGKGTGGLDVVMPPAQFMTDVENITTFHYGLSFSPEVDDLAKRRGEVAASQRYLYPGEDAAIIRTVFKEFLWNITNNDQTDKGVRLSQAFFRRQAKLRGLSIEDAFLEVTELFTNANRQVARQLAPYLHPGAIVEAHDMHFIETVGFIGDEYLALGEGRHPKQVSVNWVSHVPFPDASAWQRTFDMGDEAPGLPELGWQFLLKQFEALSMANNRSLHIDRYVAAYKETHQRARGSKPYYRENSTTARHVHPDTEELKRMVEAAQRGDTPEGRETRKSARTIQRIGHTLEPGGVIWLLQTRKADTKKVREWLIGIKQYSDDVYAEYLDAVIKGDPAAIEQTRFDIRNQHAHCRLPDSFKPNAETTEDDLLSHAAFVQEVDDLILELNEHHLYLCSQMGTAPRGSSFVSVTPADDFSREHWIGETASMDIPIPGEKPPPKDILLVFPFPGEADGFNVTLIQGVIVGKNGVTMAAPTIGAVESYPEMEQYLITLDSSSPHDISAACKKARHVTVDQAEQMRSGAANTMPLPFKPVNWQKARLADDIIPALTLDLAGIQATEIGLAYQL